MKTIGYFSLLIFCLNTNFVKAQSVNDPIPFSNKVGGYSMSFGGGTEMIQGGGIDLLNKHLGDNGYALVPTQLPAWSFNFIHAIYNNTVFDFGINGIFKRNTVNDSSKTTITGTSFNLGVGRVILHSKKTLLYPLVKANFGNATLHSHYSGYTASSDLSASNSYNSLDVSLNLDYLFNGMGDKVNWNSTKLNVHGSGVLSLSVGYIFCPIKTYWNDDNFDISDRFNKNVNYPVNVIGSLTSSNFSMFYATLKIGFGAFACK